MPDIMSLMMVAAGAMMMASMQRSESWNISTKRGKLSRRPWRLIQNDMVLKIFIFQRVKYVLLSF
ncbi:Uncharacterised protein [Mycobacteroides abscessus]|nr:Uncharacterised protein [Mycobacteroides abscessus]